MDAQRITEDSKVPHEGTDLMTRFADTSFANTFIQLPGPPSSKNLLRRKRCFNDPNTYRWKNLFDPKN